MMKTNILILLAALFLLGVGFAACNGKDDPEEPQEERPEFPLYYWYQGEKIDLTADLNNVRIIVDSEFVESSEFDLLLQRYDLEWVGQNKYDAEMIDVKFNSPPANLSEYSTKINIMRQDEHIYFVFPFLAQGEGYPSIGISCAFYLKLKQSDDITLLEKMVVEYGVELVRESIPLWYVLSIQGSGFLHSIDATNFFYETGLFEAVDPAFMFNFSSN